MGIPADAAPASPAELAALRRDLYALFAGLLADPASPDTVALLHSDGAGELLAAFDRSDAVERLRRASVPARVEALRREFWDLFVVPGRRYVTPSQSVYLDVREVAGELVGGLTMGDSALYARRVYRSVGFEASRDRTLPPDHVAVELAFMAALCAQEVERPELVRVASDFLRATLLRWLPLLGAKVAGQAASEFYPAVLELVAAYVDDHAQDLAARAVGTAA